MPSKIKSGRRLVPLVAEGGRQSQGSEEQDHGLARASLAERNTAVVDGEAIMVPHGEPDELVLVDSVQLREFSLAEAARLHRAHAGPSRARKLRGPL